MISSNNNKKVYLLKALWNWAHAGLLGLMALTGFEIHGLFAIIGYKSAVSAHQFGQAALLVFYSLSILGFFIIIRRAPYRLITNRSALIAGLIVVCVQIVTGLLYLTYGFWASPGVGLSLGPVAYAHTFCAFVITAVLFFWIYMNWLGKKFSGSQ